MTTRETQKTPKLRQAREAARPRPPRARPCPCGVLLTPELQRRMQLLSLLPLGIMRFGRCHICARCAAVLLRKVKNNSSAAAGSGSPSSSSSADFAQAFLKVSSITSLTSTAQRSGKPTGHEPTLHKTPVTFMFDKLAHSYFISFKSQSFKGPIFQKYIHLILRVPSPTEPQ